MSKSLKKAGIEPGRPVYQRGGASGYETRGMYSSITLENFRGFERLELTEIGRINLLFGPNNSGKTSVLEGIYTHAAGLNFQPFFGQVVVRRQDAVLAGFLDFGDKLRSVFRNTGKIPYQFSITAQMQDDKRKQELNVIFRPSGQLSDLDPRTFGQFSSTALATRSPASALTAGTNTWDSISKSARAKGIEVPSVFIGQWTAILGDRRKDFEITYPFSGVPSELPFKLAAFHDILAHRQPEADLRVFSHLKRYGVLGEFVDAMASTFAEVEDVDIIPYPDGTQGPVYVRTRNQRILPLYAFGDGMRRWYYLLGSMLVNRKAVHCIEEIDSTMHPSSQLAFCRQLATLAERFDNQVFLTSHNIEFADAFLQALYGEGGTYADSRTDPVRVLTLRTRPDGLEVWPMNGKEAFEKRGKFDLELRG